MICHLILFVQNAPAIDFEKWGSFGLALMLLIWFVGFLIKQMKYYRQKVEDQNEDHADEINQLRKTHKQRVEELQEQLQTLHNQRQQETQATVEALKETKKILQEQLQGHQKTWETKSQN